ELAPKTVTLQNPSITLSQALEQVKQQTGIEVADLREDKTADPSLKLNLQRATFWQSLDAIAREADLRVSLYEKDAQVALREGPRRAANALGLLKGDLSVIGPGKMLVFTFDKLAKVDRQTPAEKVPAKTQDGVTVKLREFTTEADVWTVGFLLEYPPGGPDFESFESWLVNNKAFLE